MENKKVSICLLTIDRYLMTKYTVETLLENAGYDNIELLILDNGSSDARIINYCIKKADVYMSEEKNIGVAKGFNKLFKEATGDYICTVGNDIIPSKNWLKELVKQNELINNSGVSSIYCLLDKGELLLKDRMVYVPKSSLVYGISFFSRSVLDKVGGFNETLSVYGYEDSEYCYRCAAAGLINYYVPFQYSTHVGADFGEDTEYRKEKDLQLKESKSKFEASINKIKETGVYHIPLN